MPVRFPDVSPRHALVAACVLLAVPFLVAAVSLVGPDDAPRDHDTALIELRTSDVFSAHPPLVGSYERMGGNMPGPWLFYLLAPATAVAGSLGMGITVLLVGWGSGVGILWIANRRGGPVLMLATLAAMSAMLFVRGGPQLANPWEPMITLLMLALFAMMLWELAAGTVRVLPLVIGLGAFLATTWLLLTPMVAVCGVFVAAVLVRDLVRVRHGSFEEGNRRLYWSLGLAALVAVVMLAPTLSEQFTLSPGNITELVGLAPSVAADRAGLAEAWDVVSIQFTAHPSWLGTVPLGYDSRVTTGEFRLPVVFVVWVMAAAGTVALMVGRRNESEARTALVGAVWLHVVVAFLTAGFLVSMALVWGGFLSWLIEPTRALGMMMALAIFFTVGSALPSRIRSAVRRPTEVVLGLGSLALVVALSFGAAGAGSPRGELSPALAELARGASDGITAHDDAGHDAAGSQNEVVLVRSDAAVGIVFGADEFGIAELSAFLERAGIDVVVDQDRENRFGAERAHPERADAELFLRSRPGPPPGAGWELVDRVDPLTSEQRSERSRVESKLDEMAHGSTMAELLVRAEDDPELDRLLQQSFAMVDQPVLYLWYRSLEKV